MSWWQIALVILGTFCAMEWVAWATHKYVMHGFLWVLHKDHHVKEPGFFEKNDTFFLIFAVPSWALLMFGTLYANALSISIGIGILLYGMAYFLVHEVFIHRRFKWFGTGNSVYTKAILRAHKMHHKHLGKEDGENFGMLLVGWKYFKREMEANKKRQAQTA